MELYDWQVQETNHCLGFKILNCILKWKMVSTSTQQFEDICQQMYYTSNGKSIGVCMGVL